jgi:hypothetical protein
LHSGETGAWFFGETIDPSSATLLFTDPSTAAQIRFGKLNGSGGTTWGPVVSVAAGATSRAGALPVGNAVGISVEVVSGMIPHHQAFVSVDHRAFELDGSLSSVVNPELWRHQGTVDGYTLFVRLQPPKPIYAISPGSKATSPVKVLSSNTKVETVRVHAGGPLTVVRAVAWDPGWEGLISVNGGSPEKVPVGRHGLVQQIQVPAGNDVVTFQYRPPHLILASVLSLGGAIVLLVSCVVALVRRGRRSAVPRNPIAAR